MKISEALFSGSSTRVSEKPKQKFPEFAFIGRSNVGKSSLINMLCRNRKLAMTSSKPGKTRLVNHFLITPTYLYTYNTRLKRNVPIRSSLINTLFAIILPSSYPT